MNIPTKVGLVRDRSDGWPHVSYIFVIMKENNYLQVKGGNQKNSIKRLGCALTCYCYAPFLSLCT